MPHIIVEHSKGIAKTLFIQRLVGNLHDAAKAMPELPTGGIRTRAHETARYRVGDGELGREFIYITVRLGRGRDDATKKRIGETLFEILSDFTKTHMADGGLLSLGLEIQEIDPELTWKLNNIHAYLKGTK